MRLLVPSVWDLVFGRYGHCMDVAESDWLLVFYFEVECGGLCLFGVGGGREGGLFRTDLGLGLPNLSELRKI